MKIGWKEGFKIKNFIVCTVQGIGHGDQIYKFKMGRYVAKMDEGRSAFKIVTRKPTG
jgi:hypothetical protein